MKDPKLGFTSPREELAEKFHMSEQMLAALNPGQRFDRAGDGIIVVDTGSADASAMAPEVRSYATLWSPRYPLVLREADGCRHRQWIGLAAAESVRDPARVVDTDAA
jgi:hypothetical protein